MASVRLARRDELHTLALVAMRAFAHDPIMTYMHNAQKHPERVPLDTPSSLSTLDRQHRLFYYFLDGLARGALVTNGRLVVVTVPIDGGDGQPPKERIVALAYWVAPGAHLDSLSTIVKAKQHRFLLGDRRAFLNGTGLTGYQRAVTEFQEPVDAMQKRECKAQGIDIRSCWHLQLVCVEPEFEGKGASPPKEMPSHRDARNLAGYCGKLMREFFAFAPDVPCLLEASTIKSRDVYLHYGFKTTGEILMGEGKVGSDGLPVNAKEQAVGATAFPMIRLPPKDE